MLHKVKRWVYNYMYSLFKTFVITSAMAPFNVSPMAVAAILAVVG